MATLYLKTAGGNWSAAGTWSNTSAAGGDSSGPPTVADDCIAELLSGNVTIDADSTCKSFSTTAGTGSWGGTLTHNAFIWTVAGSITFNSGITYTPLATSTVTLSAANTLTTAGKPFPSMILSSGTTTLGDNLSFMASKFITLTLSGNTLNINGKTVSGNSAINRVLIRSSSVGTARTITTTTGTFDAADFQDITASTAIDLSAVTNFSGNCGGNTNITFTTAATQTYTGGTDNWSTLARWTSRVPLPQDDVLMSGVTGGTITSDMPRLGKNITWTGASGTPTWTNGTSSSAFMIFGSVILISAMSMSAGGNIWQFSGRGIFTITSSGVQWANSVSFIAPSGTHTLQDAFSTIGTLTMLNGTFNAGGFNVTASTFTSNSGTITRAITMGTGTWTSTNTGGSTVWNTALTTNLTFSGASSIFVISGATASTRVFSGGGLTFGTLTYTIAGSTGQLSIVGSNTFDRINFSDITNARTLAFTAATTTTILSDFIVRGTSGKLMSVQSVTAATHTLTKASGVIICDYLSVTNSIATGGAAWYAGANSTNVSGNTGWIFTGATISKTITGLARITISTTKTLTGKARLQKSVSQTISGLSRIMVTTTKTITGNSRIQKLLSKTLPGLSRITALVTQAITGKARIRATTTKTITGKGRVRISTTKTITGKGNIVELVSQDITGKSKIVKQVWYVKNNTPWQESSII